MKIKGHKIHQAHYPQQKPWRATLVTNQTLKEMKILAERCLVNNRKRKIVVILSSCQWAALSWWAESEKKLLPVTMSWLYQLGRMREAVLGHYEDLHPWVGDFPDGTPGPRRSGLPSPAPAPAPACDAQGISTEQEGKPSPDSGVIL